MEGKRGAIAAVGMVVLSACATGPNPEAEVRGRAWDQVMRATTAVRVGEDRLRVEASTPFVQELSVLDYTALGRIAGEATRAGAPRFALVYVDYEGDPLASLLVPEVGVNEATWIGTYEDLLAARELADLTGSVGGLVGFRKVAMVALLLDEGERTDMPTFDAASIYDSMLTERVERKDIEPKKRLRLPRLRLPSL